MTQLLSKSYYEVFGEPLSDEASIAFAPGRICILGEHIDYNGGLVLPAAIRQGTYCVFEPNRSDHLNVFSDTIGQLKKVELTSNINTSLYDKWLHYIIGVWYKLFEAGVPVTGGNMYIQSDLPIGASLSSSASLELSVAMALKGNTSLVDKDSLIELAKICQKAEVEIAGLNCGIMDQFAVAMGRKDHALLLDCRSLAYQYIPVVSGPYKLVIIHSHKERQLTESAYNTRVLECAEALSILNQRGDFQHLAEVPVSIIETIENEVLKRRARHVSTEQQRVKEAADELVKGKIEALGDLMFASQASLRHDYEVTCFELDVIDDFCRSFKGCVGAKQTGAGFGGCMLAWVHQDNVTEFEDQLSTIYLTKTGLNIEIIYTDIADGVRLL